MMNISVSGLIEQCYKYKGLSNKNIILVSNYGRFGIKDLEGRLLYNGKICLLKDEKIENVIISKAENKKYYCWLCVTTLNQFICVYYTDEKTLSTIDITEQCYCIFASEDYIFVGCESGRIIVIDTRNKIKGVELKLYMLYCKNMIDFEENKPENLSNYEVLAYSINTINESVYSLFYDKNMELILVGYSNSICGIIDINTSEYLYNIVNVPSDSKVHEITNVLSQKNHVSYMINCISGYNLNRNSSVNINKLKRNKNDEQLLVNNVPICSILISCNEYNESELNFEIDNLLEFDGKIFWIIHLHSSSPCCYLCIFDLNIFLTTCQDTSCTILVTSDSVYLDKYYNFIDIRLLPEFKIEFIDINHVSNFSQYIPLSYKRDAMGYKKNCAHDFTLNISICNNDGWSKLILVDRIINFVNVLRKSSELYGELNENHFQDILCSTSCEHLSEPCRTIIYYLLYCCPYYLIEIIRNESCKSLQITYELHQHLNRIIIAITKKIISFNIEIINISNYQSICLILKNCKKIYNSIRLSSLSPSHTNYMYFYGMRKNIFLKKLIKLIKIIRLLKVYKVDIHENVNEIFQYKNKKVNLLILEIHKFIDLIGINNKIYETLIYYLGIIFIIESELIDIFICTLYYIMLDIINHYNIDTLGSLQLLKMFKLRKNTEYSIKSLWFYDNKYYKKAIKYTWKIYKTNTTFFITNQLELVIHDALIHNLNSHMLTDLIIYYIKTKLPCLAVLYEYLFKNCQIEYIISELFEYLKDDELKVFWLQCKNNTKIYLIKHILIMPQYKELLNRIIQNIPETAQLVSIYNENRICNKQKDYPIKNTSDIVCLFENLVQAKKHFKTADTENSYRVKINTIPEVESISFVQYKDIELTRMKSNEKSKTIDKDNLNCLKFFYSCTEQSKEIKMEELKSTKRNISEETTDFTEILYSEHGVLNHIPHNISQLLNNSATSPQKFDDLSQSPCKRKTNTSRFVCPSNKLDTSYFFQPQLSSSVYFDLNPKNVLSAESNSLVSSEKVDNNNQPDLDNSTHENDTTIKNAQAKTTCIVLSPAKPVEESNERITLDSPIKIKSPTKKCENVQDNNKIKLNDESIISKSNNVSQCILVDNKIIQNKRFTRSLAKINDSEKMVVGGVSGVDMMPKCEKMSEFKENTNEIFNCTNFLNNTIKPSTEIQPAIRRRGRPRKDKSLNILNKTFEYSLTNPQVKIDSSIYCQSPPPILQSTQNEENLHPIYPAEILLSVSGPVSENPSSVNENNDEEVVAQKTSKKVGKIKKTMFNKKKYQKKTKHISVKNARNKSLTSTPLNKKNTDLDDISSGMRLRSRTIKSSSKSSFVQNPERTPRKSKK